MRNALEFFLKSKWDIHVILGDSVLRYLSAATAVANETIGMVAVITIIPKTSNSGR